MSDRRVRCAVLTQYGYWFGEALLACPGLELLSLPPSTIGLPESLNPFGLPEDDMADVALVTAWWYRWLTGLHPDKAAGVMRAVERRARVLVGVDGPDQFALTFPSSAFSQFDVVLKLQGVYRDRDLYNYVVGPQYEGANWTRKLEPRRPSYTSGDLEKLRLSVPCYVTGFPAVRRRSRSRVLAGGPGTRRRLSHAQGVVRDIADTSMTHILGLAATHGRPRDVHCLTSLTHIQRIEAMRLLSGLSGTLGIAADPTTGLQLGDAAYGGLVSGTAYGGSPLPVEVVQELERSAAPFLRSPVSRPRFLMELRRHKVVFAPTGYGELGDRHGLALLSGAALVCQDLSHVHMMVPLRNRENVVFCRPDLSDLRPVVEELIHDDEARRRIGRSGRVTYMDAANLWRHHLEAGIEAHILEALQIQEPSPSRGDGPAISAIGGSEPGELGVSGPV